MASLWAVLLILKYNWFYLYKRSVTSQWSLPLGSCTAYDIIYMRKVKW